MEITQSNFNLALLQSAAYDRITVIISATFKRTAVRSKKDDIRTLPNTIFRLKQSRMNKYQSDRIQLFLPLTS